MENQPPPFPTPEQQPSDPRAQKINAMWKATSGLYVLAALGLVMYWEFNDEGLPMTICEWQARILDSDSCYVALNILGSLLVFLIPLFIAKFIVEKVTGVKIEKMNYKR